MTIQDVENMSAAELKERKAEIIKALALEDPDALAARYVGARLDAKLRDEKLAEQAESLATAAKTIDALTAGTDVVTEKNQSLAAELEKCYARLRDNEEEHEASIRNKNAEMKERFDQDAALVDRLRTEIETLTARGDTLSQQATRAVGALTTVHTAAREALTTVQTAVDDVLAIEKLDATD